MINKIIEKMEIKEENGFIKVKKDFIRDLLLFLAEDFESLIFLTCVEFKDYFELIYLLRSYKLNEILKIKTEISIENPEIKTISNIYSSASWHEREVMEMFGVKFDNHPYPCKLLLQDEIEGYPMRKDFINKDLITMPRTDEEREKEFLKNNKF